MLIARCLILSGATVIFAECRVHHWSCWRTRGNDAEYESTQLEHVHNAYIWQGQDSKPKLSAACRKGARRHDSNCERKPSKPMPKKKIDGLCYNCLYNTAWHPMQHAQGDYTIIHYSHCSSPRIGCVQASLWHVACCPTLPELAAYLVHRFGRWERCVHNEYEFVRPGSADICP